LIPKWQGLVDKTRTTLSKTSKASLPVSVSILKLNALLCSASVTVAQITQDSANEYC
jgi:hypothetical protein